MFDFLPAAEVQSLLDSPLQQVIAQVRFGSQSMLGTHEGAGAVHDSLADMYPRLLAEQQQVVTMTPSGATLISVPQYRMTDLDRSWSVVVGMEQLTVESSKYSNWTELYSRLEAALKAVSDLVQLRVRERVGLRYVNLVKAHDDGSFKGRVSAELIGPAGRLDWNGHLTSFLSQITASDDDAQMILRVGVTPQAGDSSFMVDIDCFNDQPREFDLKDTLSYFDQLNDACYRCFCWCVPAGYRSELASAAS
jgi:uncharacterized protein (TIGR04255 family)